MFSRIVTVVAAVALTCGAAMADDPYEDAAEAWRDYNKELRKGDYDDAAREWRKYQRAQSRIHWRTPVYSYPTYTYSYPAYTHGYSSPAYTYGTYYGPYPVYTRSYRTWAPRTTYYRGWVYWR